MGWFWVAVFTCIIVYVLDQFGVFKDQDRSDELEYAKRAYRDRRKKENHVSLWERIYRKFY